MQLMLLLGCGECILGETACADRPIYVPLLYLHCLSCAQHTLEKHEGMHVLHSIHASIPGHITAGAQLRE
jgi:hypothetical protein